MTDAVQADILLKSFHDAVMADAIRAKGKLEAEMEAKREAELAKARREISDKMNYYIHAETEKARNAQNQRAANHGMGYRKTLLGIRKEIEDEVFAQVGERMQAQIGSVAYDAYFSALLRLHEREFRGQHFVFEVGPADKAREAEIRAVCPDCAVHVNGKLTMGGFIATAQSGSVRIVETTESRLDRLRELFCAHADLIIDL